MSDRPLATVIVNNYNYGRFLKAAIDSALGQTYQPTEVVVVDDGSTDDSRRIIAGYGDRIRPVLKENGGQTSAFNAAFHVSRGEVVCFLDADDWLLPSAMKRAVGLFQQGGTSKVHWPLCDVDEKGEQTGELRPHDLAEGDLRDLILREGPQSYLTPPTSGNAWGREFLERVFPLPEVEKTLGVGSAQADDCLSMLAPLFGRVRRVEEPQGCYRLHAESDYSSKSFEERLRREQRMFDHLCRVLEQHCRNLGLAPHTENWVTNSWNHRLQRSIDEILDRVPPGGTFILADQDEWALGEWIAGRRRLHFPERGGQYWGLPPDDATAIKELEHLGRSSVTFLVVAWPAFWWLDYFPGFHQYLRSRFRQVLANDRVILFDLRA
jgi:glycosyltransferase involved in cell wall biosynthesis